jgi:hypothetical protein
VRQCSHDIGIARVAEDGVQPRELVLELRPRRIGTAPSRPPGYREQKKRLLAAARVAFRGIKQSLPAL